MTNEQIAHLTSQGCTAERWDSVLISPATDLSRIQRVHFGGTVTIGSTAGTVELHGMALPCGLYDARIMECEIGDGVRIAGVRTGISRYTIGRGACIQDSGMIAAEPGAIFGNGLEVEVINEGGGRGTTMVNRLTSQVAYMHAMFRHDRAFLDRLHGLLAAEARASIPERGIIGEGATVVGCPMIRNVVIGPAARCEGAALLENGTVNSCPEHPTLVGSGVHARDFIIAEGARIESGALVEKVFIGQGVKMGKQYSAENSLFFANCEAFHGEGVALFAGPYTVTHHKSTLMIAGLFSFYNAGSGTNQSNHMYKLGPVHQGVFERGAKTGSFSYVLFESHISPFTVVIGKHLTNIRVPNLPFSYISEKGGESSLVPGMNLFSVGTVRDGEKWPKRDNRKGAVKRDLLIFDVFSPYTVEKMRRGRDELLALHESTPKDRATVPYGGLQISRVLLRKGAKYYQSAIVRYLYDLVIGRICAHLKDGKSWAGALEGCAPAASLKNAGEWTDLSGLLVPVEVVREIERGIASGSISSYDALLAPLQRAFDLYRAFEWQYAVETFARETGTSVEALTKEKALELLEEWEKAALSIQSSIIDDSKKEFGPLSRTGYGLDGTDAIAEGDFAAVRGSMETNGVVKKMAQEAEAIASRAAEYRKAIASS